MNALLVHLAYDSRSTLRDRGRMFMIHGFPLAFFLMCAAFMVPLNPFFKETMLPGMALFAMMSAALLAAPSALVQARESGVFRSFRVNGVPAASVLSVPPLATAPHVAVVVTIIAVAGARVFGGREPASAAGFAAAAVLSYAVFAGIGALIGVAAGTDSMAILLAQLVYVPSCMLGGLMIPERALPASVHRFALLLPSTHCMRSFAWLGGLGDGSIPWSSLAVLVSSLLLSVLLARALFEWDARSNRPSRRSYAAILVAAPYVVAATFGR